MLAVAIAAVAVVVYVQHHHRMQAIRDLHQRLAEVQEQSDVVRFVERHTQRRTALERARDRGWDGPVAYIGAAALATKDAAQRHPGAVGALALVLGVGVTAWLLAPSIDDTAEPRPTATVTSSIRETHVSTVRTTVTARPTVTLARTVRARPPVTPPATHATRRPTAVPNPTHTHTPPGRPPVNRPPTTRPPTAEQSKLGRICVRVRTRPVRLRLLCRS